MIEIDGSLGEGGGQVLRTALGLSLVTGRPFTITNIRAGRARPGLLRQHLAAVRAAVAVGAAAVEGDTLGSTQLRFAPTTIRGGTFHVAVGSAGSTMLVVQAVLPALLVADTPTQLIVEGGTDNPAAPPVDFLDRVFFPLLRRMGADVQLTVERRGFYPAGGGRVVVDVRPAPLTPLDLTERGDIESKRATAIVSGLPVNIAHRELHVLQEAFHLDREALVAEQVANPHGPGNIVLLEIRCSGVTELFSAVGEKSERAEIVARRVVREARDWIVHGAPVGEHLADQLLVPMALAPGGRFRTGPLSSHTRTNIVGVGRFLPVPITEVPSTGETVELRIG